MRSLAPVLVVAAYFTTVATLYPSALTFDGLSFLMGARAGTIDYGHALYMPLLRAAGSLPGATPERAAQLVSAAGATVAFALLWRRVERGGAPRALAFLVAACFGLAPLVWQEAGAIEPTSWTIAALLAAAEAADAYARSTTLARLVLLLGAFATAVGFHLVSLCALPWLVSRAWRRGTPLPRAHLLAVLGASALVLLAALTGGELGLYLRYWSGFLPAFEGGVASELAWHLERGGKLALEGAPVLLALAAVALVVLLRARVAVEDGAWLAAPYLLAYLVLGKPLVGLLMPVFLGAALVLGRAAAVTCGVRPAAGVPRPRAAAALVLGISTAIQVASSLPQALAWRREPDDARTRADLLARHVPDGTRLFAGPLANHLRYYRAALDVVSLPELLHRARARDRSADPVEVVGEAVRAAGKPCLLTTDGAGFLQASCGADLRRLGLSLEGRIVIPEDPALALFPLPVPGAEAARVGE